MQNSHSLLLSSFEWCSDGTHGNFYCLPLLYEMVSNILTSYQRCQFWRFTTSTSTSAQRRRTSIAIIFKSLNTFGVLPGREHRLTKLGDAIAISNRKLSIGHIWLSIGQLNLALSRAGSSFFKSGFFPLICWSWPRFQFYAYPWWVQHSVCRDFMHACNCTAMKKCIFRNQKLVFWVRPSMASFILQHSGLNFRSQPVSQLSTMIIPAGSRQERMRKA